MVRTFSKHRGSTAIIQMHCTISLTEFKPPIEVMIWCVHMGTRAGVQSASFTWVLVIGLSLHACRACNVYQ